MFIEIIFEGERRIVDKEALAGYQPCEIICEHQEMPEDNLFGMTSREHLISVHTQKALESILILSGYNLTQGLLFEEAQALDLDLIELAQKVQDNRAAEREFEVGRRQHKHQNSKSD